MPEVLKTVFITEFALYNMQLVQQQIRHLQQFIIQVGKNIAKELFKYDIAKGLFGTSKQFVKNVESVAIVVGKMLVPTLITTLATMQGIALYAKELPIAFKAALTFGRPFAETIREAFSFGGAGLDYSSYMKQVSDFNKKIFADTITNRILLTQLGISGYTLRSQSPEKMMSIVVSKLMEMEHIGRRNAIAAKLFGAEWQDILYVHQRISELNLLERFKDVDIEALHKAELAFTNLKISVMELWVSFGSKLGPTMVVIFSTIAELVQFISKHLGEIMLMIGSVLMFTGFGALGKATTFLKKAGAAGRIASGAMWGGFGIAALGSETDNDVYNILQKQTYHLSNIDRNTAMISSKILDVIFTTGAGQPKLFEQEVLSALLRNVGG